MAIQLAYRRRTHLRFEAFSATQLPLKSSR